MKRKNNSGITLIALIVTIIVMLILVAATVRTLIDSGLFQHAGDATNKWAKEQSKESEIAAGNFNVGDKTFDEYMESLNNKTSGGEDNPPTPPTAKPTVEGAIESGEKMPDNTELTDENGDTLTVPKDFTVKEGETVDEGVVVVDENGNEYVWVPVPDPSTMYTTQNGRKIGLLYNYSSYAKTATPIAYTEDGNREPAGVIGSTAGLSKLKSKVGLTGTDEEIQKKWEEQLQNEFDAMINSVIQYKGFYIGRYETGEITKTTPVVKSGSDYFSMLPSEGWYMCYQNSKNVVNGNDAVTSGLIWGCQWDATLNWFLRCGGDTASFVYSSDARGNYVGNSFTYMEDGQEKTKQRLTSTSIPTGSASIAKVNNIYDLGGNMQEWTMEAYGSEYRVSRGGNNGSSGYPVSSRKQNQDITSNWGNMCGRVALYINVK